MNDVEVYNYMKLFSSQLNRISLSTLKYISFFRTIILFIKANEYIRCEGQRTLGEHAVDINQTV